jgi:3-oxoadipate enol-lactonase
VTHDGSPTDGPVALHHVVAGPADAPVVLLGPSLGTTLALWDGLADALSGSYRVVRFDTRGHGGSPVPTGPYTLGQLTDDVVALADSLGADRFGYVGLSLGGAIGQVLAADHPGRVRALVLCCTGPRLGEPETWHERAARVRSEGMGWLVGPTAGRWFTPGFMQEHPERARRLLDMIASVEPEGYAACCDALAGFDMTSRLGDIEAPTRVVVGEQDPVSPPSVGQGMVEAIPESDLVVLEDASHIANVAQPEAFAGAVLGHLRHHL